MAHFFYFICKLKKRAPSSTLKGSPVGSSVETPNGSMWIPTAEDFPFRRGYKYKIFKSQNYPRTLNEHFFLAFYHFSFPGPFQTVWCEIRIEYNGPQVSISL